MNQYTYHTTVLNADGDFRRMIKPSALFRYVEQAAADHARAYGMDDAFFKAHHTAFLVGKQAAQIIYAPRSGVATIPQTGINKSIITEIIHPLIIRSFMLLHLANPI